MGEDKQLLKSFRQIRERFVSGEDKEVEEMDEEWTKIKDQRSFKLFTLYFPLWWFVYIRVSSLVTAILQNTACFAVP